MPPSYPHLALPPELRLMIYDLLFSHPPSGGPTTLHDIFYKQPWTIPSLTTCREMRREGLLRIYSSPTTPLHLTITSYQFADFETVAAGPAPDQLCRPVLALGRRNMAVNPACYTLNAAQFYGPDELGHRRRAEPLPASLFRPEMMRSVSLEVVLVLYRDACAGVSMKIVWKLLHRLTHLLMPNLRNIKLRVRGDEEGGGRTGRLLESSAEEGEGRPVESGEWAGREAWIAALPGQIGRLPVRAEELQVEGVSDEVWEVIARAAKVSR